MGKRNIHVYILFGAIVMGLLFRFRLLFIRQFDPDEFAYLHWAWLTIKGMLPYRDFFYYGTPIFLWFLTPVLLLPEGPVIAIAGRLLMFVVFLALLMFVYKTSYYIWKNRSASFLAVLFITVFPMTFDKTLEIRPDTLMVTLFLLSFLFIQRRQFVASGIVSSFNSLMFMKILVLMPSLLPVVMNNRQHIKRNMLQFFLGGMIPVLLFLLYIFGSGIGSSAWEAVTTVSRFVNNGTWGFPALTGLMPFPFVYMTEGGISFPWIINTSILVLSLMGIPVLWLTTRRSPSLFMFAVLFYLESIVLFLLFPRPHMQYFIPLSVSASILAAGFVETIGRILSGLIRFPPLAEIILGICAVTGASSLYLQFQDRIHPGNNNEEQLQVLADVKRIVKPNETMYDEVGSYIFRPDGYFICCHHYEQFWEHLDKKLQSLKNNLIENQTKFIVLDQKGFAFWTPRPEDVEFITTNYAPSIYKKIYTLGVRFQCSDNRCIQLNVHGAPISSSPVNQFNIRIDEQYKISISPETEEITINNSLYKHNDSIWLPKGTYTFSPRSGVTNFSVQLDR